MSSGNESTTVDVVIVGSGFAGLAAAVEAATKTGSIWILEKMDQPGGNSIMNAGQIAAVGTPEQKMAGIQDSVERMMNDMIQAGVHLNHPNLLKRMIEESNDIVQWTRDVLGVKYRTRVTQLGGHSVPRTLSTLNTCGRDIIDPLLAKVKDLPNVSLLTKTTFVNFLLNDEGTSVTGVNVEREGRIMSILCNKGVILANGGFSADVAFRSIQNPSFGQGVMTTNQPGATAEVIKEALKIGAMSVQLSRIQLGPWTSPDEDGFGVAPLFCIGAGFPYGIIVDPDTSKRFVNELGNRYERSMAILGMGHPVICITDAVGAQHSLEKNFSKFVGVIKTSQSVEELSREYGMNPVLLKSTIDSYNAGVEKGFDEQFGKPLRDDLKPIVEFPLYSVRLWPKVHHCMGGLHINSDAQVMHIDGYPIGHLYACGEVAGGVHGGDRLGSCATLDCLSYGRIAGRNVAKMNGDKI
jgi:flavocytochrome c